MLENRHTIYEMIEKCKLPTLTFLLTIDLSMKKFMNRFLTQYGQRAACKYAMHMSDSHTINWEFLKKLPQKRFFTMTTHQLSLLW